MKRFQRLDRGHGCPWTRSIDPFLLTRRRPALLGAAAAVCLTATGLGQEIVHHIDGSTGERIAATAGIGDIDLDGTDDFVVGGPGHSLVRVYSGRDYHLIYEIDSPTVCCEGFGSAVDAAGDFDGDGVPDFVVGDKRDSNVALYAGAVHVYSGADGSELAVMLGAHQDDGLGRMVTALGDVNQDGFDDVGASGYSNRVRIYGGPDGHLIRMHDGPTITRPSIDGVGDLDGDGRPDYVIGWPQDSTMGQWAGRATVYSGRNGSVIHDVFGTTGVGPGVNGDHLGASVAWVPDVDGDGLPEFAVGAPGVPCLVSCGTPTQGYVRLYSGDDAKILQEWSGLEFTNSAVGGGFGLYLYSGGDLNGDSVGDLLVSAPWDIGGARGSINAFSGESGGLLWKIPGENVGSRLREASILGDLNHDGLAEWVVADGYVDHGGPLSGRVTIYAGFPADVERHCRATPTSTGTAIRLEPSGPIGIANDGLSLVATGAVPGELALAFYGSLAAPAAFGDGWLCTAAPTYRLGPPGTVAPDGSYVRPLELTLPPLGLGPGRVDPGETWSFQLYCRDPAGPGGSGFNLSSGLAITFAP